MNFLFTGAARGIGRGVTKYLLSKGHRVLLVDNDYPEIHYLMNSFESAGFSLAGKSSQLHASICDLRSPADIQFTAEEAAEYFDGHLDVLVNNAGKTPNTWSGGRSMGTVRLEEWNDFLAINLTAPFLMTQACVPMLKRSENRPVGGCVINISSTRAKQSEKNSEGYAASKAGLLGLTHSMAISLGDMGIRVNAILPGWINVANECREADEKGMKWEDGLTAEDHRWHPAGRVGKAEDIAKAVLYLAESDFITAEELVVDGGVTKRMVYPE